MQLTIDLNPVSCGTEVHIIQEGLPDAIPPEACYLAGKSLLCFLQNWSNQRFPISYVSKETEMASQGYKYFRGDLKHVNRILSCEVPIMQDRQQDSCHKGRRSGLLWQMQSAFAAAFL